MNKALAEAVLSLTEYSRLFHPDDGPVHVCTVCGGGFPCGFIRVKDGLKMNETATRAGVPARKIGEKP